MPSREHGACGYHSRRLERCLLPGTTRATTLYHTTDANQLHAADVLLVGEEILFAFKRGGDSEELVFATESTI